MGHMEKAKRYMVFLVGLFISSLGVSLITKADLGTSPNSSIPYVLSLNLPWSMGTFTVLFSVLLILLQLLILRRGFRGEYWLQLPLSFAFGYFIDLTMLLIRDIMLPNYPAKVAFLVFGCAVLGFGVYLEVVPNVAMLPAESFVRAVAQACHKDFGLMKIVIDAAMTLTAIVLSFLLARRLDGVREGTVIAALLVGFFVRRFQRLFRGLDRRLFDTVRIS